MARRSNGEGNVRERKTGVWEASVMLGGRRYYATGKTEPDVRKKLRDLQAKHALGNLTAPTRLTVAQHLGEWLEAGAPEWKPRTLEYYRTNCELYLVPAFGHRRLQALTAQEIARQFARWRESLDVSGGTLLNVYKTLHRALTVAVFWGRVPRNVVDGVEPPRARRKRPELWTMDEARRFVEVGLAGPWAPTWALLIGTGCRVGEAIALEWTDVDLDAGRVRVAKSSGRIRGEEVVTGPKTLAGDRSVELPDFAIKALRSWRLEQLRQRLAAGVTWAGSERVLTRSDGSVMTSDSIRWGLKVTAEEAQVRLPRIHDLRHLHASLLLAEGLPLTAVASRLGHASSAVTASVYAHSLSGSDVHAAQAVQSTLYA